MGAAQKSTHLRAGCRRQTSVTAGTILHASKLPLTVWFWAAYLMATHSNGISALQLQKQLGIGSYRSAWLLAHKLRASMVATRCRAWWIDEASLPFASHRRARTQPRRQDAHRRRHRTRGRSRNLLGPRHFVETAGDAIAKTDGWSGYAAPRRSPQCPASARPPHLVLRGSTKSSPTSKDGREASTTGCVASICRPISMSSSFASTAAKPATLLSARSSASPPEPLTYRNRSHVHKRFSRIVHLQHFQRTIFDRIADRVDFSGINWRKTACAAVELTVPFEKQHWIGCSRASTLFPWDRLALMMSRLEKLPERHEFYRLRMRVQRKRDRWGVQSLTNWLFDVLCDYGWSVRRALCCWCLPPWE